MKINKIIGLFIGLMILMVSGCDPIVDEQSLKNTTDVAGVELIATQSTPGGNKIELLMATPGITGYWDYNLGTALTDRVTIVYPIPGKATFTYVGTLGAEFFTKTIDVQIDKLDTPLDQDYYDLVSENTSAGKTWVFAGTGPDTNDMYWYMSPPNDPASWGTAWWNAGGTCCPPSDVAGSMKFDLNGAANFTYTKKPGEAPVKGSFVLNTKDQTIQINGANLLGNEGCAANKENFYKIISLTEDEMILYVPLATGDGGCWTGWTWKFKPQEDL
jgi:hypothetical protein